MSQNLDLLGFLRNFPSFGWAAIDFCSRVLEKKRFAARTLWKRRRFWDQNPKISKIDRPLVQNPGFGVQSDLAAGPRWFCSWAHLGEKPRNLRNTGNHWKILEILGIWRQFGTFGVLFVIQTSFRRLSECRFRKNLCRWNLAKMASFPGLEYKNSQDRPPLELGFWDK